MARRPLCLIVNPSAGRGRTARLLPRVEAELRSRGLAFRTERTYSLAHARELARETLERGEIAAGMGGDGLLGAIAGELRGTDGVLSVLPGGRGNDFARKLGVGTDPVRACALFEDGRETAIDVADAGGATFLGIASAGIDSDVQIIANATRIPLGGMIYVVSTLRALDALAPRGLGGRGRRRGARLHRVLGRGGELGRLRRRHVPRAGRAARRRAARRRPAARLPAAEVPRQPAAGVPRDARPQPRPHLHEGAHGPLPREPARTPPTPTATRSRSCPSPSPSCPAP